MNECDWTSRANERMRLDDDATLSGGFRTRARRRRSGELRAVPGGKVVDSFAHSVVACESTYRLIMHGDDRVNVNVRPIDRPTDRPTDDDVLYTRVRMSLQSVR